MICEDLNLPPCKGCVVSSYANSWVKCWVEYYGQRIQDKKMAGNSVKDFFMDEICERPHNGIYLAAAMRRYAPEYEKLLVLL